MRHTLICHPDTPCAIVSAFAVEVARGPGGTLYLQYIVSGSPRRLRPSPESLLHGRRADELWLHSCFEAFVRPEGGEAYIECNLAPTRDWQSYALSGYRRDRHVAETVGQPAVDMELDAGVYVLRTRWDLGAAVSDGVWRMALSAVIEDDTGALSYWALRHTPGQPDFHHDDAFAITVAP